MACEEEGVYSAIMDELMKEHALDILEEMGDMVDEKDEEEMKKACHEACESCGGDDKGPDCEMCGGCMCVKAAMECDESEGQNEEACAGMAKCQEEGVYGDVVRHVVAEHMKEGGKKGPR